MNKTKRLHEQIAGKAGYLQFFNGDGGDDGGGGDSSQKIIKEMKETATNLKSVLDKQSAEIKKHGETTTETQKNLKSLEEKYDKLENDYKGEIKEMQIKMGRTGYGDGGQVVKTAGGQFVDSEAYKAMVEGGMAKSSPHEVKSFFQRKDLSSASASAGDLVIPQQVGGIFHDPQQEMRLRDLLNVAPTTSNAIEYVEEKLFENNARMQAEGTAKAQSNITFERKDASVKTLAHWLPATKQILADAGQLQSHIDNRLIYGLKLVEEEQILYGDGTGENLQGIMTHADIQDHGAPGDGDTKIDHIRRALTKSRRAGYPTTGIVLAPEDWEAIELTKGSDNRYIWVSVTEGGASRLWRVPVVESLSINPGEFLTGAFGLGAQLWDREQANVQVAEQHSDFFTSNKVAIRAEERLAQTIYRPKSFVKGLFEAAEA